MKEYNKFFKSYLSGFVIHQNDPELSVTSNFINPFHLLLIRAFFTIYIFIVIVICIVYHTNDLINIFGHMTNISFYSLFVYLLLSLYLSIVYVRRDPNQAFQPKTGIVIAQRLLYHTNLVFAFLISLTYWSLLFKEDYNSNHNSTYLFLTTSMHGFNYIIISIEFLLTKAKFYFVFVFFVQLFSIFYLVLSIIIHEVFGVWTYFFMDYNKHPLFSILTFAFAFIAELIYGLLLILIHKLRDALFNYLKSEKQDNSLYNS
ncbi:hypothetical protein K502DRAFT_112948 [Neoconidiobolus thromboides FSU 785]|nr:hypothetical protein K502DRAFT_112948 [Neoconidiobolus thromboides FSU 785]